AQCVAHRLPRASATWTAKENSSIIPVAIGEVDRIVGPHPENDFAREWPGWKVALHMRHYAVAGAPLIQESAHSDL
ncbi:MAG: hypothetical protein WB682_09715, partial [Candidatus Dormiibacterota bacterium]